MPVDVEGHLGLDNRFYVIDTARCTCQTLRCQTLTILFSIPASNASKRVTITSTLQACILSSSVV